MAYIHSLEMLPSLLFNGSIKLYSFIDLICFKVSPPINNTISVLLIKLMASVVEILLSITPISLNTILILLNQLFLYLLNHQFLL
jgi:hypothetical protein